MQSIPPKLAKDLIRYTLPLLLITSSRGENLHSRYWAAVPGSFAASILIICGNYCGSKSRLILSSILYLGTLLVPSLYFFSLGFILNQSYNTNIFRSQQSSVNKLVFKVEIIGLLASESINIPFNIRIAFGIATLISSILVHNPCVEAKDPFECMKTRIDSASALSLEYRFFLKRDHNHNSNRKPCIVDVLYMITRRRMDLLFSILFSFELSDLYIFLIGVLFVLGIPWEFACLLLKTEPAQNVSLRVVTNYVIYFIVDFIGREAKIWT